MPQGRPEVTRLSVKDELRFQAWAHRNGITDVDHPDSHYDYRGYWRSTKGAPHEQGAHFPDTFKQHGHPTFSVESKYSRGPNDGGHWQGENFIPPRSSSQPGIVYASQHDQRIPSDILPAFRPRNRAAEVAGSLAFNYPRLAGTLSGAGNVVKGAARFIPDAIRGLSSFSPEDLRDPAVRKEITDNGWGDPDQMLHEALRARGRGEPVGSAEYAASLLKGTALAGYNLQRAVQGGALFEQGGNGKLKIANPDVSPRERAQAITEMLGNTGLLAAGVSDKSLPISRLPLSEAGRAAAALRDAVGPSAILPQDWTALSQRARGVTPVGNLNLEAPAYQRATYKAPVSAPNTSLDVPTFKRNGSISPAMRRLQAENNPLVSAVEQGMNAPGFTLDASGKPFGGSGYLVADPNLTVPLKSMEDVTNFLARDDVKKALDNGGLVGGWHDPSTGAGEINITSHVTDRADALKLGTTRQQKAIGEIKDGQYAGDIEVPAERIHRPEILGANGKYYTGLNHDLASEAAAEAMRATPEGRAAMQKNGGSATVRGSQGFETTGGRHITREEARNIAGATGQAPTLASQYTQLHSSDISNPHNFAGEHPVPQDLISSARRTPAFDPSIGAPQLSEMARYGRPESGSILDPIAPGTLLRDVPQTPMTLPGPKDPAVWQDRYQQAMQAFQNPLFSHFLERGAERNYPWWYNADPILASAVEHLGPEAGMQHFTNLMRYMKPTSINTSPEFNLRNAGYQFWRTGHPDAPRFVSGFRPLYPTLMERKLAELESGGGHLDPLGNPKIEPYGENFMGNWRTHAGDMHFWRAMGALGLDLPISKEGDTVPGLWHDPVVAALDATSHDIGSGYVPDVPGRSMVAPLQATMWGGAGDLTGVKGIERARPSIWQMFEDATHRSAQHLGMTPNDFLGQFWNRERPLF